MKSVPRGFALGGLALGVGALAIGGSLAWGLHRANKKIGELGANAIAAVDKRMGEVIRAIPGERWLQIIDDLNGPDESKRQAAQAYLKNVAHIDLGSSYEVSAAFGFDDAKPLRAQIFAASTNSRDAVELYLAPDEQERLSPVRSMLSPAPTPAELRANMIVTSRTLAEATWLLSAICNGKSMENCKKVVRDEYGIVSNAYARYDTALEQATDAALLAFHRGAEPAPLSGDTFTVSWAPLKDQYVIVAINAEDLDAHRNDLCSQGAGGQMPGKGCIRVWVHPAGKPEEMAFKGGLMNFSIEDFYANKQVVKAGSAQVTVRYAARRPDPGQMFDTNALRVYQDMAKLRAENAVVKSDTAN